MRPHLLSKFNQESYINIVRECFGSGFPDVFDKRQVKYIFDYLDSLGAKTIILETEYLDRDFFEDYSRFYIGRFNNLGYKAARLHFFKIAYTQSDIESIIESESINSNKIEEFINSYLGFSVIKPLEKNFIGKTCLCKKQDAAIVINRDYRVNLYGIDLNISGIAFQEQDKIVSACATTAIWTALHAIRSKNIRDIPSCSKITINAINHVEGSNNIFPRVHLSNKQMLRALDIEGLKHHSFNLTNMKSKEFYDVVRYHVDSGLPMILGSIVYQENDDKILVEKAGHAIVVIGYDPNNKELIIHDDRIGPYVRAKIASICIGDQNIYETGYAIDNDKSWGIKYISTILENEIQLPNSLIIPAKRKMRVPYDHIHKFCLSVIDFYKSKIDTYFEIANGEDGFDESNREDTANALDFTITVKSINRIRKDIFELNVSGDAKLARRSILMGSFARYQWEVKFKFENTDFCIVYFDATDIPNGNSISEIIILDKSLFESSIGIALSSEDASDRWLKECFGKDQLLLSFVKKIRSNPNSSNDDYHNKLTELYGEIRAPYHIKPIEIKDGDITKIEKKSFYNSTDSCISEIYESLLESSENVIWLIDENGVLHIGGEKDNLGHPVLAGFRVARIGGEISEEDGVYWINTKSGRYTGDRSDQDRLLNNAVEKFKTIFWQSRSIIQAKYFGL